jgi:hypothetical protein
VILTDKQRKQVEAITRDVAELALTLRHAHGEDDAPEDSQEWQLSATLHAAEVKLTEARALPTRSTTSRKRRQMLRF